MRRLAIVRSQALRVVGRGRLDAGTLRWRLRQHRRHRGGERLAGREAAKMQRMGTVDKGVRLAQLQQGSDACVDFYESAASLRSLHREEWRLTA